MFRDDRAGGVTNGVKKHLYDNNNCRYNLKGFKER